LGQVTPEGNCLVKAGYESPTEYLQYMQNFQESVELTEEAAKVAIQYEKNPYNLKKILSMSSFMQKKEMSWIFHRLNKVVGANGQPQRMSEGILNFTSQVVPDAAGVVTETNLLATLRTVYQYGDEVVLFAGAGALDAIWKYVKANSQFHVTEATNEYGFRITRLTHQTGSLMLMPPHPLLTRHPNYTYLAFGVNFDYVEYKYLTDVEFRDNQQQPGCLQRSGQWYCVGAPIWRNRDAHFVINNLQSITVP
jgi:hypothetical protein